MLGSRAVGRMRPPITVGLALFLAVGASIPGLAAPSAVRADCGGSGPYARTTADVRGTAFIGVYEGYEDATDGDAIVRWDVEQVVAGDIPTGSFRKRTFECALTLLIPGERYLFTTGARAGKEMASYANSIAWLVAGEGATIAPFVDQQDPPQVAQDVTRMPAWARDVATVGDAIALVTGGAAPGPDASPSPVPSAPAPTDPPGVVHESLGVSQPEDGTVGRIELLRTTLAPGAAMPPTRFVGDWVSRVEAGVLSVTLLDGAAGLRGATGAEDDPISEGPDAIPERTLGAGQVLWAGPDAVLTWENRGSEPVTILSTAVTRGDDVVMAPIDPDASPGSAFGDPVVKRIVLTGPGSTGDRYRITVADRSGQVVGARVPTDRELRFASGGDPARDYRDLGIGPVAYLDGGAREMLVRWMGTPCGPVVTMDVAKELSAIRVLDRTPGCDAAGVGYAVVLRLKGSVPPIEDIDGSWVRR